MRLLPCGGSGLLVEVDDLDAVLALYAELVDDPPDGVVDLVPAARTLLLRIDPARTDPVRVARAGAAAVGARSRTGAPSTQKPGPSGNERTLPRLSSSTTRCTPPLFSVRSTAPTQPVSTSSTTVPRSAAPNDRELELLAPLGARLRIERLAGVGHFVHEEAPELVMELVERRADRAPG